MRKLAQAKAAEVVHPASVHLANVQRATSEWQECNTSVLQAVTVVMNAVLESSDTAEVSTTHPSRFVEIADAEDSKRARVHASWEALTLRFEELAAGYRNIKASCESVMSALSDTSTVRWAGPDVGSANRPDARAASLLTVEQRGAEGGEAGGQGAGGQGAGAARRTDTEAQPSWPERCAARVHDLLNELLCGYGAQLALTQAIITRLKPWPVEPQWSPQVHVEGVDGGAEGATKGQEDEDGTRSSDGMQAAGATRPLTTGGVRPCLPSFPCYPGLPPWAQADRDHLTALASTLALPPYVDQTRVKSVLEAVGSILKGLAATTAQAAQG